MVEQLLETKNDTQRAATSVTGADNMMSTEVGLPEIREISNDLHTVPESSVCTDVKGSRNVQEVQVTSTNGVNAGLPHSQIDASCSPVEDVSPKILTKTQGKATVVFDGMDDICVTVDGSKIISVDNIKTALAVLSV